MIVNLCNVETTEYALQAMMYSIICTHHRLHSNGRKQNRFRLIYVKQLIDYDGSTTSDIKHT